MAVLRSLYLYSIGFDPFTIGLLSTVATIVGAIRSAVVGILADRYGKKNFIILGDIFSTVRFVIYSFFTDFTMLVIAQGIGAFGEGVGAGQPTITGIIADNTKVENRTKIFSVFAITNAVASTFGSLLANLPIGLQDWFSIQQIQAYQIFFLIGAVFSVISTFVVVPLKEKREDVKIVNRGFLPKKSWSVISKFSFVRSVGGFGFGLSETLIPLWFKINFGVGEEVISIVYATSRFLSIFSYLVVVRFALLMGEMGSITITRLISSVMLILMMFSPGYLLAGILLTLYRVSLMFTMPIRQSFITYIVDPSERASAVGISNFSRMSVRSFGPTIGGYLMQNISTLLPFFFGSGVIAVNGFLYYLLFKKETVRKDN